MGFLGDAWSSKYNPLSWPGRIGGSIYDKVTSDPGTDQEKQRKALLYGQAESAGNFANTGETGFGKLGWESAMQRDALRRLASGQDSIAAEQGRQSLGQLYAQQQSMAASGAPNSAPMMARTAMMNAGRLGAGMAGQTQLARLQEQQNAQKMLADAIAQQRALEAQVALGARNTAVTGYGAGNAGAPEKSWLEKYGPAAIGGGKLLMGG